MCNVFLSSDSYHNFAHNLLGLLILLCTYAWSQTHMNPHGGFQQVLYQNLKYYFQNIYFSKKPLTLSKLQMQILQKFKWTCHKILIGINSRCMSLPMMERWSQTYSENLCLWKVPIFLLMFLFHISNLF